MHIDAMNEYLMHLDRENTENMKELIEQSSLDDCDISCPISMYDLLYFVSNTGLQSIQTQRLHIFLSLEDSSLQKLSMVMYRTK